MTNFHNFYAQLSITWKSVINFNNNNNYCYRYYYYNYYKIIIIIWVSVKIRNAQKRREIMAGLGKCVNACLLHTFKSV